MLMIYFCLGSMGLPPELMPLIRPYYLIVLAGMIPVSVLTVFSQWCSGPCGICRRCACRQSRRGSGGSRVAGACMAMIAACCLFIFGGSNIMGLFTDDAAVLSLAVTLIFPLVLYQLGGHTNRQERQ